MDYSQKLTYHFRPNKGWINDPNGLGFSTDTTTFFSALSRSQDPVAAADAPGTRANL